jgi:uncharacterized protein
MTRSTPDAPKPQAAGNCPICGAPSEQKYRPFCSRRCADVDLSRWLRGAYAIPVEDDSDEDGESADGSPIESDGDAKSRKP